MWRRTNSSCKKPGNSTWYSFLSSSPESNQFPSSVSITLAISFFPSQTWAIVFDHQGHLHLSFPGLPENLPERSSCIIQFSLLLCCCRFHGCFPKCKSTSENHDSDLELLLEMLLRHQMYSYRSAATHRRRSAGMLISRPWTHLCTGVLAGFVNKGPSPSAIELNWFRLQLAGNFLLSKASVIPVSFSSYSLSLPEHPP